MVASKRAALAAILALGASSAWAATVDSFQIDVSDINGQDSNIALTLGTLYEITVSGEFIIDSGFNGTRFADAEYFDTQTNAPRDTSRDLFGQPFDIGVQINNIDIDWGAYADDHIYSIQTDQLSGVINMRLAEVGPAAYLDNAGVLLVEISTVDTPAVPLPAGLPLALTGLGALAWVRRKREQA